NYIQLILSVPMVIGYQLVTAVFDVVGTEVAYAFLWWRVLIPAMWSAAALDILANGNLEAGLLVLRSLAIVITLLPITLYYILVPAFEQNLEKLLYKKGSAQRKKYPIRTFLGKILCTAKEEKYFIFAYQIMGKEREFKLKVFPS